MAGFVNPAVLRDIVDRALREDLPFEDITSAACFPEATVTKAAFRTREPLVLAGIPLIYETFRQLSQELRVTARAADGDLLAANVVLAEVEGPAQALLAGERVALNFLQHLSGIATTTQKYVAALTPGSTTRITDTRKTTPGLRPLQRYAVRCGGGHNHRNDLSAGVLIKDNHIAACGGIRQAISRARNYASQTSTITCEVDTLDQLHEALAAGTDCVLLDNFSDASTKEALEHCAGKVWVEASGGITMERVAALSALGVNSISVGALTHSHKAVDIGLDTLG